MFDSVTEPSVPTTITSRQFNQDTGGAKKAATLGPVFITDRGEPSHVLLSIADYLRLTGAEVSVAEALRQSEEDDTFEFDPPRAGIDLRPVDLE